MDLFGSSAVRSYGGNRYTLVIVDDYSRYTWTRFLKDKTKAFDQFEIFSKKIQNQLGCTIVSIRTDHGREFDNEVQFGEFCNANGITHNFSAPRTPQSNGVVERKNRTLQEMSRTMLNEQSLPQKFWCNAVDTSTYILNQILIRAILGKTPYELLRGRKPTLDYFRVFGSKCFILNTKDYLTKFDPKSYEGVFLEPKNVNEALTDDSWIVVMQEELNQFIANNVWELVPQPRNMTIIGTKWVFRNKLDENDIVSRNKASVPSKGRYKTTPPSPNVIKSLIQVPRQGQVTRNKNKKTIVVDKNKILSHEIQPHMKPWVDIIRENAICLGGHRDHLSACLCHMLYCIETSTPYNLAFFILKRMEKTRNKPKELLPYGMLLTRLFKHTRSDHGKKRPRDSNASSSSTTLNHPSSSRPLDDIVDENDEESFHSNSSSPSQNVSSSSNVVSRVRQNPLHESPHLNTYLSETINLQAQ
ncbi:retrovirus-related pol polyprotein from transposon TNT 1-94 [Tanacetum coccineum]